MQPDSDGPETSQAFPIASGRPALIPETSQKAFSSFDFAAFQASTSDQTKADANAKEAQLQQAAQYFLSSSDDDDASEDNAQPERNKNAADARSSKPEKKRKRKYRRPKREKDVKRSKTEAEKIIDIERREAASGRLTRSFKQGQWLAGDATSGFYVDTHADKDNLAFEGLYRMNIAAYHRLDPTKVAAGTQPRTGYAYSVRSLNGEVDDQLQRGSKGKRRRYFLAAVVRREQDALLKRLHVHSLRMPDAAHGRQQPSGSRLALPMPTFMPLAEKNEQPGTEELAAQENAGETAEQYMMRRIKNWNVAVRERPHELQLWLDFAAFQDEISKGARGRRVSEAAIAEKKISILEQALKYHPGSDELLLALLTAAETVLSPDDMLERWQSILRQHSSSGRLWRAYTAWQRTRFATFTISSMQQAHRQALAALRRERERRRREGAPDEVVAACERDILVLLLEYLQMQMQSGHTERAVACVQALLEFNCFSPDFPDIYSKQRAFRQFWMGGSPLIGDEGAAGWNAGTLQAAAAAAPAPAATATPAEETANEEHVEVQQPGGWGGWEELPPIEPSQPEAPEEAPKDLEEGELDEDAEAEFAPEEEEESEEALMAQLGLKLEQELAQLDTGKGLDAGMAAKWGAEETKRECSQWQPVRSMQLAEEADVATARVVDIEDVEDFLIDLGCEDVREELVLRLLGLLGLDLTSADCSNAFASTQQRSLDDSSSAALSPLLPAWHPHGIPLQAPSTSSSADSPSDSAPASLPTGQSAWILPPPTFAHTPEPLEQRQRSAAEEGAAAQHSMQLLPVWYLASEERRLFVLRLLSLGPFQDSCYFAEALLDVMAASALSAVGNTSQIEQRLEEVRALLAQRREQLPLWHAYGLQLYKAGQAKAARKVYSTLLASLPGMPQAYVKHAPPMVLAHARAELKQASKDAQQRALHALMWLGSGGPYERFKVQEKGQPPSEPWSSDRLLQARRGYQAMLSERLGTPAGQLTAASGALVSCAALFELLLPAIGGSAAAEIVGETAEDTAAAVAIYEQALAATPVEVRKHSAVHEGLAWELCCMLAQQCCAGSPVASPKRARSAILEALQVYPASARLMALLSILEMRAHTVSRLRRDLRALCDDSPSPQAWLMAARTEAQLAGSAHRVQAVLERGLASKGGQQCGLLWRAALGFELSRGRPEAARRIFLRGIHACPWSKALWMDGLVSIGEAVSAQERSELLDVMQDKEVHVRTETYEILLAAVAEQQLL